MGDGTAHHARVAIHDSERQAGAAPDALVRVVVRLVLAFEPHPVAVQRVGVLHPKLAQPNQAAARPQLVPELGLHLVHQRRQLAVGVDLAGGVKGDHLLVGHRQHQVALAAVAQPHQGGIDLVPAPGGLPQLGRMDHRQQQLLAADPAHLLVQDLLDLA